VNKTITFFCIGAQKSGTTTLHNLLVQHPDVVLPTYKESHFFSDESTYKKGLSYYFDFFFPQIKPNQILGEVDPAYLACEECPKRIFETFGGNLKFIVILRNPIDRAFSAYLMAKSRGFENLSFEEALQEEQKRILTSFGKDHFAYMSGSKYTKQLKRFYTHFPKENFHIITFDEFTQNQSEAIEKISVFLNLNPFSFTEVQASNRAHEPKSKFIRDFIFKPNVLKKAGHLFIPSRSFRGKIMHNLNQANTKPLKEKPILDSSLRESLYFSFFKEEIEQLEQLINYDLSAWKYGK